MTASLKSSNGHAAPSATGAPTALDRDELGWVQTALANWAMWSAAGGVNLPSAGGNLYTNKGAPPSTAADRNCTAHDLQMLAVDAAVNALPRHPNLCKVVHCMYRRDMGRAATAQACGVSVRTIEGRLRLAYYHVAQHITGRSRSRTDQPCP